MTAMTELPDEMRVPLHELQADMKYLIGRVAADGSCASMIASTILEKLSQIERAALATIESHAEPVVFDLAKALSVFNEGLEPWASKPHNKKWWKRIDGTPILNDLSVNVAEAFIRAMQKGTVDYAHPAPEASALALLADIREFFMLYGGDRLGRFVDDEIAGLVDRIDAALAGKPDITDSDPIIAACKIMFGENWSFADVELLKDAIAAHNALGKPDTTETKWIIKTPENIETQPPIFIFSTLADRRTNSIDSIKNNSGESWRCLYRDGYRCVRIWISETKPAEAGE